MNRHFLTKLCKYFVFLKSISINILSGLYMGISVNNLIDDSDWQFFAAIGDKCKDFPGKFVNMDLMENGCTQFLPESD